MKCPRCGYWGSTLVPQVEELAERDALDQVRISEGLSVLRRRNYVQLLKALSSITPLEGKRLLDVGSSTGLFVEMAKSWGIDAEGLEPDPSIVARCRMAGREVRQGFFPDALGPDECFDIISFNDVLEHIPDPVQIARACFDHLADEGVVIVNLPNSRGLIYRIATILNRIGIQLPMRRLWQEGFRSPHLHYFSENVLQQLFQREGFQEIHRMRLEAVATKGLWARINSDNRTGGVRNAFIWTAIVVTQPLLRLAPPDITAQIFLKQIVGQRPRD